MARYIDADELYKATQKRIAEANEARMAVVDDEFLDLINDAFTEDVAPRAEWISVKERVPDGNGVFIVSLKERGYENLVYFDVRSYADGEWRNLPDKFTVSHWMPLPEPPKGD